MVRMQFSPATRGTYSKEIEVPAEEFGLPNANPPSIVDLDNITLYSFTVNTDRMTYELEIPEDYASGGMDIFIMWTNDGGADDNGKNVKCHPHIFRHTFATMFSVRGGSPEILQLIMGHESFQTTQKYLHPQPQDLRKQHLRYSPVTDLFGD